MQLEGKTGSGRPRSNLRQEGEAVPALGPGSPLGGKPNRPTWARPPRPAALTPPDSAVPPPGTLRHTARSAGRPGPRTPAAGTSSRCGTHARCAGRAPPGGESGGSWRERGPAAGDAGGSRTPRPRPPTGRGGKGGVRAAGRRWSSPARRGGRLPAPGPRGLAWGAA